MDKIEIYHYLKRQNIAYEITEHKAVFNMEEADAVDLPYPEWGAKNLFVRDDKKRNYYLITMKGNKRVDLKAFRRQRGLRALSFAAAEELFDIMKLTDTRCRYAAWYSKRCRTQSSSLHGRGICRK